MPRMREKESDEHHLHHLLPAGAFLGLFLGLLASLRSCPGDAGDAGDVAGSCLHTRRPAAAFKHWKNT